MNYSAEALMRQWPQRFPSAVATVCARKPECIANRAYANREGNNDEAAATAGAIAALTPFT